MTIIVQSRVTRLMALTQSIVVLLARATFEGCDLFGDDHAAFYRDAFSYDDAAVS